MIMSYPERATVLDPDELEGLKLPHIEMRGMLKPPKIDPLGPDVFIDKKGNNFHDGAQ